jgi:hypothetical protein
MAETGRFVNEEETVHGIHCRCWSPIVGSALGGTTTTTAIYLFFSFSKQLPSFIELVSRNQSEHRGGVFYKLYYIFFSQLVFLS